MHAHIILAFFCAIGAASCESAPNTQASSTAPVEEAAPKTDPGKVHDDETGAPRRDAPIPCDQSQMCRERGLCGESDGRCLALKASHCRESERCKTMANA